MQIVFRVDASVDIGTGHVMRCLTLADQLIHNGNQVISFICGILPGDLCLYIEKRGYVVYRLSAEDTIVDRVNWENDAKGTKQIIQGMEQPVDWLIVDHYQIDYHWELEIRSNCLRIMVIDDLANRYHECNILLDQNYHNRLQTRYDSYVPSGCFKLLGPEYLLLRPEFRQVHKELKQRTGFVHQLLIFYGGSDPTNETMKALRVLSTLSISDMCVNVVVGSANPHREDVRHLCMSLPSVEYHCQIDYMAQLIAKADLALGAGGGAMWERCFLGLPSITTIVAENQKDSTVAASEVGVIWNIGWHGHIKEQKIADILNKAIVSPLELKEMSRKAMTLMHSDTSKSNRLIEELIGRI